MAHSISARKRVRQSAKRRVINRARKSMLKTQMKHFLDAVNSGDFDRSKEQYRLLTKRVDKIAATSTLHKNTASRIKSRMARRLQALQEKAVG